MFFIRKSISWVVVFFLPFVFSCTSPSEIENVNYDLGSLKRNISADLPDAVSKGIDIPTKRQIPSGYFKGSVQFHGDKGKKYFYKIYYRNESYKFPEGDSAYNPLAEETFYGSWQQCTIGFQQ